MEWTKEQQDAINLEGKNIIVSAGAGSGKTAVLTERVIRKVKAGISIDKLLVLTFTNASALEMKNRIRDKLIENNLTAELDKLESAYITTFDSYALSIVKKYHHLLNIDKNLNICDSSIMNIKKVEILDDVFLDFYSDESFQKFINDFCSKNDNNVRTNILDINDSLDMIYKKEEYLNQILLNYNDEFINSKIAEYTNLLLDKIKIIKEDYETLITFTDDKFNVKLEEALRGLFNATNYNEIANVDVKLPTLRNADEEAKKIKEGLKKKLDNLKKLITYSNVDEIRNSIYKTKDSVEVIIKIIREFDKRINAYKKENNLYEFVDIAKMGIYILENFEEVRKELDYNEILIDEYQDTNDLQDLFISYLEHDNVYMVGDVKQSIYRFRNANPLLFKEKYENYSNNNGGIKIDLNKNFRSRKEVLDNINLMFDEIMDSNIGGADYKKSHRMIYGNMAYENTVDANFNIELHQYDEIPGYTEEEIEAFTIANDIKKRMSENNYVYDKEEKIVRPLKYSDICILLDRYKWFSLYKKIFEYMNIPLNLYQDISIKESEILVLFKNVVGFLIDQDKKFNFTAILRSFLFQVSDQEIFDYVMEENYDYLNDYLISLDDLTPLELTNYIIDKFEFYEKLTRIGNINDHVSVINFIFDVSKNVTDIGYSLEEFYEYLKQTVDGKFDLKYKQEDDNSDAVKMMSIHGSKGLEFHICYYADLTHEFNINELKNRILYDRDLGIVIPTFDEGIRHTIYKNLLKDKFMKEEISERIRLLYVSLTRAEEKMIIVKPYCYDDEEIDKMSYNSFADIINSLGARMNEYFVSLNADNLTHDYSSIRKGNYESSLNKVSDKIETKELNIPNSILESSHFSKENNILIDEKSYRNMQFGTRIHEVFEHFDFLNPDYSNLDDYEINKVKDFFKLDLFKGAKNIYKEYEFIYEEDNVSKHGVIDLLIEYEDSFRIVDYKLKNIDDPKYLIQLSGYKAYIQNLTGKNCTTYLYSITDNILKEAA